MDLHSLSALLFGNGTFWLVCTFAAVLAVWRHYTEWPLVTSLSVAMNGLVMLMLVGGWVLPAYFNTWEPAMFNFGMWWMVPMLLWIYAGFNMPVGAKK